MALRIFLHIGCEKTGTTSVQRWLHLNRTVLLEKGYVYPTGLGGVNQTSLTAYSLDDVKIDTIRLKHGIENQQALASFRQVIEKRFHNLFENTREESTIVLSNEHLSSRLLLESEVLRLKTLIDRLKGSVTLILYIRRQDEVLESLYSTSLRSGFRGQPAIPAQNEQLSRYRYDILINRWAAVFGEENIILRRYERSSLVDGDIISDFKKLVGIGTEKSFCDIERLNEALDHQKAHFLRGVNQHLPPFVEGKLTRDRGNIAELLDKIKPNGPKLQLPFKMKEEFLALFDESNQIVADKYFNLDQSRRNILFAPLLVNSDSGTYTVEPISMEDQYRIFSELWRMSQCADPKVTEQFMQIIRLVFSNLKTWLNGIHHGVIAKHLQAYLNRVRFSKRD